MTWSRIPGIRENEEAITNPLAKNITATANGEPAGDAVPASFGSDMILPTNAGGACHAARCGGRELLVQRGSNPVLCGQSPGLDGLLEPLVVGFGLVCVSLREAREGSVGDVALAEIAGENRGIG